MKCSTTECHREAETGVIIGEDHGEEMKHHRKPVCQPCHDMLQTGRGASTLMGVPLSRVASGGDA